MHDRLSPVDYHLDILEDLMHKLGYGEIIDYTFKGIHKFGYDMDRVRDYVIGPVSNEKYKICFEALWKTIMRLPQYRKDEIRW